MNIEYVYIDPHSFDNDSDSEQSGFKIRFSYYFK
jgi:hypothetical protein